MKESNIDRNTVERVIEQLSGRISEERLLREEMMSKHTSFRIGGPAALMVVVNDENELSAVLNAIKREEAEHILIGNGSNLLVADEGYPGVVIKLSGDQGSEFGEIEVCGDDPTKVKVGAAKLMSGTSSFLTEKGLAGFEFASGIPGSIGGAVFMNAGAYGGEMKDIVETVRVMDADGTNIRTLTNEEMDFSYRHSAAEDGGFLVLSAVLKLRQDDPAEITARVMELQTKRNSKQPINYPSAGSTFKRPVGGFAAALIEESGLKGFSVGGAEVSEKHSGFVINKGGATAADVIAVMKHVREKVFEDSGIMLEPEVRMLNCSL